MMRFSEAIRLGGMMAPKAKGEFFDYETGGLCVQGAALKAVGAFVDGHNSGKAKNIWPYVKSHVVGEIPEIFNMYPPDYPVSILEAATNLNDLTDWTREQIADWVETRERALGLWEEPQAEVTDQESMAMIEGGTT